MPRPPKPNVTVAFEPGGGPRGPRDGRVMPCREFTLRIPESVYEVVANLMDQRGSFPQRMHVRIIVEGYVVDA